MTKTKYLLATALLALCISLASGMALAQVGWIASDQDLPSDIAWDATYDAFVEVTHVQGTDTIPFGDPYGLVSVQGVTAAASAIDRWGRTYAEQSPLPYYAFIANDPHPYDLSLIHI